MNNRVRVKGEAFRVYHAEVGDFALSKRIRIPLPPGADPDNPPTVELEGSWDRRFLLITENFAIEFEIVVSESLISFETDLADSKYERIHKNLTKWRDETAPENIQEIEATDSPWCNGRVVFVANTWPAIWINQRSLTANERQVVQNAQLAEANKLAAKERADIKSGVEELREKERGRKRVWRAKGGAATLKLAQCPAEATALKQYIKRRAASLGRRGMSRAISEGRAWFKTKYRDCSPIVEKMHDNSLRNFVTGKTGRRPKGNSKR